MSGIETLEKGFQKAAFRLRWRGVFALFANIRKMLLRAQGMKIGEGTQIPRIRVNWPHQVSIGRGVILQEDVIFQYDSYWTEGPSIVVGDHSFIGRSCEFNVRQGVSIGKNCLIAAGCKFVDQNHGIERDRLIRQQPRQEAAIEVGEGAWLGANVVVLMGVRIGEGAVVGSCALVNKNIPAFEIWAGVPARKIGERAPAKGSDEQGRLNSEHS
jgi:acetyltransferase-like isoleucine patch superfamily enzyme